MTHAALAPLIGPEFDKFLCASIGEDRNGTMLSVLSALARLDVDPWREAASLARMSEEEAAGRLTALIDALPDHPTKNIPADTIAAALVALLPRINHPNVRPPDSAFAASGLRQTQILIAVSAVVIMMFIFFALSTMPSSSPANDANPSVLHPDNPAIIQRKPGL